MTSLLTEPLVAVKDIALARDLLAVSTTVLITTHKYPDGDAVGSVLGTTRALRAQGKTIIAHTPDPPPAFLRFLPDYQTLVHAVEKLSGVDLVIALDHSDLDRTGLADRLLTLGRPLLSVDHHVTADRRASVAFIVPKAAATCELLEALFPLLGLTVDADTATCLLTGIITDTGFFQHANTTPEVLAAAERLLARGADLRTIIGHIAEERSLAALRIAGRALERLAIHPKTGAAVSVVTREDLDALGADVNDLTGVVNLLNTIPESSFALLLTEVEEGKLKGSLRSGTHHAVDVSAIARRLGGGGHTLASGFEVAGRLTRDKEGWRIE